MGVIFSCIPSCQEYGAPWSFIVSIIIGLGGVIGYLAATSMEGACMDRENLDFTLAVSAYAAIIGIIFYFFAAVAACGAKRRR